METSQVQSNKETLDWDVAESTVTAWSKATSKRRRVYGQKGTCKTEARRRNDDANEPPSLVVAPVVRIDRELSPVNSVYNPSNKQLISIHPTPTKHCQLKSSETPFSTPFVSSSARGRSSSLQLSSSLVDLAWESAKENRCRIFSISDSDLMIINGSSPMLKAAQASASFPSAATTFSTLAKMSRSQSPMDWMKLSNEKDLVKSSEMLSDLSSPAKSTGSSRKRGVSCTPGFDDVDDAASIDGFSGRSRSRSRLLSPSSSKKVILESSPNPPAYDRKMDRLTSKNDKQGGDSSESETESNPFSESDSSVDSDDDVGYNFMKKKETFASVTCRRFSWEIFTSSKCRVLDQNSIFDSMSSYDDLKFLIKALRRERDARHFQFGFVNSWSVVPPVSWPHPRRTAFRRWVTEHLGFSLRVGGGAIVYFQIATSKGKDVLESLERALISFKAISLKQSSQVAQSNLVNLVNEKEDVVRDNASFASDKEDYIVSVSGDNGAWNEPHVITQLDVSSEGWEIETELIRSVKSLEISRPSVRTCAPLTRHVTLDQNETHSKRNDSFGADEKKRSRPSSEHQVTPQDFMLHLHGFTPARTVCRPPRMSNSSVSSSAFAGRMMEASPFIQPPFSVARKSSGCASSFDFVETPLIKQCLGWGSRPVANRDWGKSNECFDSITRELLERVDVAEECDGCSNFASLRCQILPCSVVSANLGFELEASSMQETPAAGKDSERIHTLTPQFLPPKLERRGSVGATAFADLSLTPVVEDHKQIRRRLISFAKHKRVSLCAAILNPMGAQDSRRISLFVGASNLDATRDERQLSRLHNRSDLFSSQVESLQKIAEQSEATEDPKQEVISNEVNLMTIFSYMAEQDLMQNVLAVSASWADVATKALANLMLGSVGCNPYFSACAKAPCILNEDEEESTVANTSKWSNQRDWSYLVSRFPWACFLGDGAFKRVYKVWNSSMDCYEALSLMDMDAIESTGGFSVLGAELAVSAMVTTLVRRAICPNFVAMRGTFTCPYEPPASTWGSADNRKPRGSSYDMTVQARRPRVPTSKNRGRFQYIRMELCHEGDVEEYLKRQPNEAVSPSAARMMLFQIAFALHAAAVRIHLKHYDVKLLNVFLQALQTKKKVAKHVVLRYGMGSNTFALRMDSNHALLVKLADYGTANVDPNSVGCAVTMAQFTTLENSPPEFMYLGDAARQGHSHDAYCLGLCMLHLFTGHAPYEEILGDVKCPPCFRKRLSKIWEDENSEGYSVLRDIILANVYKDENGDVVEGEPDETMYDTFYRYLVLFGVPTKVNMKNECGRVWRAVDETLLGCVKGQKRGRAPKMARDAELFEKHRATFSLSHGTNKFIARARTHLESMPGGIELLMSLVSFDPVSRATFLDVLNSPFMEPLREDGRVSYSPFDDVRSFTAFSTS